VNNTEIGAEWRILELACLSRMEGGKEGEMLSLIEQRDFSYGALLEQAIRHKMQFVIAKALLEEPLVGRVPSRWKSFFRLSLAANKERNRILRQEAVKVSAALVEAGLKVAARKGVLLETYVYGSQGMRWMEDIDLMAKQDERVAIEKVISNSGYTLGKYDYGRCEIKPHEREYLLKYRLNPDHLPRYTKVMADSLVSHVEMDICTSFTWWNSGIDIDIGEALAQTEVGIGQAKFSGLPGLPLKYMFLDLILHFFREAYFESTIQGGTDVVLSGFLDIMLVHQHNRKILADGEFGNFAIERGVGQHAAWVLSHLDLVMGTKLCESVGLAGIASKEFMQSWRKSGGRLGTWSGTMRERLAARDRIPLFV
jgi:hypothetical protein